MRIATLVLGVVLAASAASAAEMSSTEDPGRKIYLTKCARCHKLYDPARYDDAAWGTWMEKMRKKAHLDDEQFKTLSTYLQSLRPVRSPQSQPR